MLLIVMFVVAFVKATTSILFITFRIQGDRNESNAYGNKDIS